MRNSSATSWLNVQRWNPQQPCRTQVPAPHGARFLGHILAKRAAQESPTALQDTGSWAIWCQVPGPHPRQTCSPGTLTRFGHYKIKRHRNADGKDWAEPSLKHCMPPLCPKRVRRSCVRLVCHPFVQSVCVVRAFVRPSVRSFVRSFGAPRCATRHGAKRSAAARRGAARGEKNVLDCHKSFSRFFFHRRPSPESAKK